MSQKEEKKAEAAPSSSSSTPTPPSSNPLGAYLPFEEDDEFEEFECEWDEREGVEKDDIREWGNDWEEEEGDDTFSAQLRAEVQKLNERK